MSISDRWSIILKYTKVIDEIKIEIDEVIIKLYPFNIPKDLKEYFDSRYPSNILSHSWYTQYYYNNKYSYRKRI